MPKRAMLIRLDDNLHRELRDGAYDEHISMVELIRRAIRAYLGAAKHG